METMRNLVSKISYFVFKIVYVWKLALVRFWRVASCPMALQSQHCNWHIWGSLWRLEQACCPWASIVATILRLLSSHRHAKIHQNICGWDSVSKPCLFFFWPTTIKNGKCEVFILHLAPGVNGLSNGTARWDEKQLSFGTWKSHPYLNDI